jgi:CRP-like cAMP-binding protein
MVANAVKKKIPGAGGLPLFDCDDVDRALEWCEEQLLAGETGSAEREVPLAEQVYCAGMLLAELKVLESMLERRTYEKGACLCREGDPADSLYFILSGQVSVSVPLADRRAGRIRTISAGSAIGEMAMIDRGKRSADIVADTPVSCLVLDYRSLESAVDPAVAGMRLKLVTNIAREITKKLRQATLEIKSLRS